MNSTQSPVETITKARSYSTANPIMVLYWIKKVIIEDYMNPEVGKEANNHEDKANSKLPSESMKQPF